MIIDNIDENEFIFYRFFLQLIVIYEDYMSKRYKESYMGIENVVKFMETCTFDESHKQYSDAYHHIARATKVYIAFTLKIDLENLLKDVKAIKKFNEAEKAAICAVKARIFMEYPPKGNDIALELAERARHLHNEPEWLLIWLKAKKRVRHHYAPHKMPDNDEMYVASNLCETTISSQLNPKFLIHAYQLCKEAGYVNKLNKNYGQSKYFYDMSSEIAKKSILLAKDGKVNSILLYCLHYPEYLLSKEFIDDTISKLANVKNSHVHLTIGRYYLDRKKNYKEAKMYLSQAKAYGNFTSSLQLIRVECLLQSVDTFPYVETLNDMYGVFQNPKRRVIILIHILIYYNYWEINPNEMMRYLKLFIDQDIEDDLKKRELMFVRSLFDVGKFLRQNDFLYVLSENVNKLINNNKYDKNTFYQFNKIVQLNIQDNNFDNDNKTADHDKNEAWRELRFGLSNNKSNKSHQQENESWRKQQRR